MGGDVEALLTALPQAALIVDARPRVTFANDAAHRLLATRGGTVENVDLVRLVRHPDFIEAVERVLASEPAASTDFVIYRPVVTSMRATIARLGEGAQVAVVMEETGHRDDAERMRSDFVANVSHELRTPLTTVTGLIEALQGPAKGDAAATERFLDLMAQEAGRMSRLIEDLLSLSRVESNERVRPLDPVDLSPIIRGVGDTLQQRAQSAGVKVVFDLPPGSMMVPGDADQLTQVVINLVENALRYGSSGGRVNVGAERLDHAPGFRGPVVRLTVSDRGDGIAAEHLPRLQERFYRVDSGRSRHMGGTGLGLAIVKHIVNRHRGRVRISSTLGEGTTVAVLIPLDN